MRLEPVDWQAVPGWDEEDPGPGLRAFLRGCPALKEAAWQAFCAQARTLDGADAPRLRAFLAQALQAYAVRNADGSDEGLVTGYYEPVLDASRTRTGRFRYPVYGVPPDLLTVDLATVYPELRGMRLRGQLSGRRLLPYPDRARFEQDPPAGAVPLAWFEDRLDAFVLEIQGSGRIRLDTGEVLRLSYADQNGHPYRAIGRVLVERGELSAEAATLPGIRAWAAGHPDQVEGLLRANPSMVFFTLGPADAAGPKGSLGVELTPGRSLAVDTRVIPAGAPVFLSLRATPDSTPDHRLMAAQDTGGAIRGAVRADYFFGTGPEAARQAGTLRGRGRLFVLLPAGMAPPVPALPADKPGRP